MRRILPYIIGLTIALWLGGLVTLFISLISIFRYNRGIGAQVGPVLFGKFEPYQIGLGLIASVCTVVWRMYACSRAKKLLLICLLAAVSIAVTSYAYLTPQVAQMAADEATNASDRFNRLHKTSEMLYNIMAVLVLIAFGSFIAAMKSEEVIPPKKSPPLPK
jgi:hypothetical protein